MQAHNGRKFSLLCLFTALCQISRIVTGMRKRQKTEREGEIEREGDRERETN